MGSEGNIFIHKTMSMYDGEVDKRHRLNHFLAQYSDAEGTSENVKKYIDLIIANGGFFDRNTFNMAMVYSDICRGLITMRFGAGLFAIKNVGHFKNLLKYFDINENNVKDYTFNAFVARGILHKYFLNGPIKELKETTNISEEEMNKLIEQLYDSMYSFIDNVTFLNQSSLKELIDCGIKSIK